MYNSFKTAKKLHHGCLRTLMQRYRASKLKEGQVFFNGHESRFQIGGKRKLRRHRSILMSQTILSKNSRNVAEEYLNKKKMSEEVWHEGGCHCGAVKFRVLESQTLTVVKCK